MTEKVVFNEAPTSRAGANSYFAGVLRMSGNIFFAMLSVVVSLVILSIVAAPFSLLGAEPDTSDQPTTVFGEEDARDTFLSIPITGVILGDGSGSAFDVFSESASYGYQVKEQLRKASKNNSIQGVILEISSPGGTIYGSQAIADGVALYKERTKKPVYAHISGLAASGGYWAAIAADKVYADYGSNIGSIGVISGPFTFYDQPVATDGGLLGGGIVTQKGIEETYITAGTSKDLGNPFRRLTQTEVGVLQAGVNNEYTNFVAHVAKYRAISEDDIRNKIGALIYDNKQAEEFKLIDGTLSRDDTYKALATAAKRDKSFRVVEEKSPEDGLLSELLGATTIAKQEAFSEKVAADSCTASRGILVYFGEVASLCR